MEISLLTLDHHMGVRLFMDHGFGLHGESQFWVIWSEHLIFIFD
jgi:hypothetical protein